MSKNRGSLRRACTLATAATLTTGLLTVVAVTPVGAAPAAVEVGTVADQLVDKDGVTLYLAGSAGVGYGTGPTARTKITGISSASSLAQAADGTVYAASNHALYAIAADHSVATVPTGGYDCLGDVAATTGAVWVVSSCDSTGATDPRVVKIANGTVTPDAIPMDPRTSAVVLASTPGAPNQLVVADRSTRTTTEDPPADYVRSGYRVFTVGSTVDEVSHSGIGGSGDLLLALSGDGSQVFAGANSYGYVYPTASAAGSGSFVYLDEDITSVAFTHDGRFVAAGSTKGNVRVVEVSTSQTARVYRYFDGGVHGLAWRAGSLDVVRAGTDAANPGTDTVEVVPAAHRMTANTYVDTQTGYTYWGQRLTVGGDLHSVTGSAARGVSLAVTRTGPGGTKTLPAVVTLDSGAFTVHDTPSYGGTYRYTFSRPADDEFAAISFSTVRYVEKHTPALSIKTDHSRYNVGQRAVITATLGRSYSNKFVSFYGKGYGERSVLLRKSRVDSHGRLSVVVYMPFTATFTARYYGDSRYSAATASVTRTAKARVDTALSKPVRKSHGYAVYRAKKGGVFAAGVHPFHKGWNIHFVMQRYVHGGWHRWAYGDGSQDKFGVSGLGFKGTAGLKYRLRASVETTQLSVGNHSSWRYVTFTN